LSLPRMGERIVLAVDVSPWLRPDAATSGDRLFCHVYGRAKGNAQLIPGWPYSFVAALETGRTSWTAVLDAVRLGPADDATAVTTTQLRDVIDRLITAGHWQPGDPDIMIVADSGYDIPRLAYVLAELPVEFVGRLRSDRVLRLPKPVRPAGMTGRPPKHGPEIALDRPATWPTPQHTTSTDTTRYGTAVATSWDQVHPRLTHRGCWLDHEGDLPIIEGTLIRLQVEHLPGDRDPKPVWLWISTIDATAADVDRWWQAFLSSLRPRTHLPTVQADPRLDPPAPARPRRRRPLDLAGHRRAHPTTPRPRVGRRPAPPLGTSRPTGPAHPVQGPPGVSEHPPDHPAPGPRTETLPTRPRSPTRLPKPTPRHQPRRRKDRQTRTHHHRTTATNRLKIKLRACFRMISACLPRADGVLGQAVRL
jgi:DDE superfamily endonuclease